MVVHDMRAPTTSTKSGLVIVLQKLAEVRDIFQDHKDFITKCSLLDTKIKA